MWDLIGTAWAQNGAAPSGGSGNAGAALVNALFMVALFAIFYFLLIRPQQKQAKAHKEMLEHLQREDTVVTSGGLMGRIHRVEDEVVVLEVGEVEVASRSFRPVRVKVKKGMVSAVLVKASQPPPVVTPPPPK